jgi:uncharacterized protein (TIGR04255 family)
MKIPTKITPDRIRDSIVQIFFESDIPFLPRIGYFHSYLLSMNYDFVSGNSNNENSAEIDLSFINHLFVCNQAGVKINLHPNGSIIFNCISNYIGWSKYSAEIHNVLKKMFEAGIIKSVNCIGVRYTSEFPNINIMDNVKFDYVYDLGKKQVKSSRFNVELLDGQNRVILNLVSNAPIASFVAEEGIVEKLSLIDIDVINDSLSITDVNKLQEEVFSIHEVQKSTFFNLLKEDFLKQLNPEYE